MACSCISLSLCAVIERHDRFHFSRNPFFSRIECRNSGSLWDAYATGHKSHIEYSRICLSRSDWVCFSHTIPSNRERTHLCSFGNAKGQREDDVEHLRRATEAKDADA